jgi:hypothetical protein
MESPFEDMLSMSKRPPNIPAVLAPSPVLITESVEEFNRLHGALKDELQINGTLEHLMLNGIAELGWGIRRYRRAKISLINSAMLPALIKLLLVAVSAESPRPKGDLLFFDVEECAREREVHKLAHEYFVNEDARKSVLEMLGKNKLDEYAIEAEAMRIVAHELEKFDRLLASYEWRRYSTLSVHCFLHGPAALRHSLVSIVRHPRSRSGSATWWASPLRPGAYPSGRNH